MKWLTIEVVLHIHAVLLKKYGGLAGLRDRGLLESALARPENLVAYGEPDAADLAAAYGFGIARNHPFADGNKRTAAAVTLLFLEYNSLPNIDDSEQLEEVFVQVATGDLSENDLAEVLRSLLENK